MLSTCPACLDMVNHDDHLMEVTCGCGHRFSPFMASDSSSEPDAFSTVEPAGSPETNPTALESFGENLLNENFQTGETTPQSFGENLLNENFQTGQSTPQNFAESTAAFNELREFAEALIPGAPEPSVMTTPPAITEAVSSQSSAPLAAPNFSASDYPITAGDTLQGYQVTQYLSPLSVVSELNLAGGDPLKGAFDALSKQAKQNGANAVVAVKWSITPDGRKVILSGTPVRCVKLA